MSEKVYVWKELKTQVLNWEDNKADISLENTDFLVVFLKALPRIAFGLPSPYYECRNYSTSLWYSFPSSLSYQDHVYIVLSQLCASLQMLVIIMAW